MQDDGVFWGGGAEAGGGSEEHGCPLSLLAIPCHPYSYTPLTAFILGPFFSGCLVVLLVLCFVLLSSLFNKLVHKKKKKTPTVCTVTFGTIIK